MSKYQNKTSEGSERIKASLQAKECRYTTTNDVFAATDGAFQEACREAKVKPTRRQASKWRNKLGAAWKAAKG